jgi:hypothetical protein
MPIPHGLLGKAYLPTLIVVAALVAAALAWWLFGFRYALMPVGLLALLLVLSENDAPTGTAG